MRHRNRKAEEDGTEYIFVRSFRHWITGALIVAPPGKAFRLRVRRRR